MITDSKRALTRVLHFLACASILLASAAAAACANPTISDEAVDAGHDELPIDGASQRFVDIFEAGAGDVTVVFESGLGNDWTPWQPVIDEVAMQARVFAYSRPGYGKSEPTEEPRDANHIVAELRALLTAHGYTPPYLLVGHSFGGTYMELFAKAHPQEVVGLVLVDPRHRDFTTACEDAGYASCSIPPALVATLPAVQMAELEAFAGASDEIREAGKFGSYPVRVLTATSHGFASEAEALWVSMLGSLAAEAENGEQKIFDGASHSLELERPRDVADAISCVRSARGEPH